MSSADRAAAIIVLSVGGGPAEADARATRIVLGLVNNFGPRLKCHVTVELADRDAEVLVQMIGQHLVETVVAHDVSTHMKH